MDNDNAPSIDSAPFTSVSEGLAHSATAFATRVALECGNRTLTYAQLASQVRSLAQSLLDTGVRAHDRVAIVLPMSIDAVVAFHAVVRIGAIAVMHPAHTPMAHLSKFFRDYTPECVIIAEHRVAAIGGIDAECSPKSVISVPRGEQRPDTSRMPLAGTIVGLAKASGRSILRTAVGDPHATPVAASVECSCWKDALAGPQLAPETPMPQGEDLAVIAYPAAPGAHPRGAMLNHDNLMAMARQCLAWVRPSEPGTETSYATWPLHTMAALANTLTTNLVHARRTILFPHVSRASLERALKKHPPTVVAGTQPVLSLLAELADSGSSAAQQVQLVVTAAEHADAQLRRQWISSLGHPVVIAYLTSETGIVCALPTSEDISPLALGVPVPSTQVRIVHPENRGRILEPGSIGLLMVRGPQVFHGYWGRADDTSAVLSGDGWLLTHDLASLDSHGCLTLHGPHHPAPARG